MKHINVVAAIIFHNQKILCVQRGQSLYDYISKKFEFPGGKIEKNESSANALVREIKEELHMDIIIERNFLTVNHEYPNFKLTMHSYICSCANNKLTLTEHIDFKWLEKSELKELDWAAADIPIVNKLINM